MRNIFRASIGLPEPHTRPHTRRRDLFISYAPDWVVTAVLATIFFVLGHNVPGFKREFSLNNTSLLHTYVIHERISNACLFYISVVAPLLLQPVINFFTVRTWWDLHISTLGLILALALTGSVTQIIKITVGRPRPDFIARCIPVPGSVDPVFGLSTVAICTQTDKFILQEGFRSFPSGHSSLSFAGLGFLAFYLAGKLRLFDRRGHVGKTWLSLLPLAAASLVAISRTMDYRHHWQDIVAGSLLGNLFAYFAYRQYYPSLSSDKPQYPFSPRIKAQQADDLPIYNHHPRGVVPVDDADLVDGREHSFDLRPAELLDSRR